MLKIIQWSISVVVLLTEVSGSCTSSAKLTVLSGAFAQLNSGETGVVAAAVYLSGIVPPSSNAVVVRDRPGFDWVSAWGARGNITSNRVER
jgi:hypothetical protein